MYGLPGSPIQFGVHRAKARPGRKSDWSKFVDKQKDLFPVDLYTAKLAGRLPARSEERASTDSRPATAAPQQSEGKRAAFDLGFSDLRRCSTADQSGVPDFPDNS